MSANKGSESYLSQIKIKIKIKKSLPMSSLERTEKNSRPVVSIYTDNMVAWY
jgi:hypothetical protein